MENVFILIFFRGSRRTDRSHERKKQLKIDYNSSNEDIGKWKLQNNKDLLCSTGNYILHLVMSYNEKE